MVSGIVMPATSGRWIRELVVDAFWLFGKGTNRFKTSSMPRSIELRRITGRPGSIPLLGDGPARRKAIVVAPSPACAFVRKSHRRPLARPIENALRCFASTSMDSIQRHPEPCIGDTLLRLLQSVREHD